MMNSFVLLADASLTASRILLQRFLACLNFTIDSEDSLLVQTKKWKPWGWVRVYLIFTMSDIYINSNLNPLAKFTSSRSTEFNFIVPWNISQMLIKITPISTRSVSYVMKQGIPLWVRRKVSGNWNNHMIKILQ